MIRFMAPLVAFGLLVLVFIKGLDPERDLNALPSPFLGKQAPQFELPLLKKPEEMISSDIYAGETVLINPIYGINWRDQRDEALRWLAGLGDPYVASGYDADGRAGINWGVYGAPETFLISRDGRVLHKHLGPLSRYSWEADFLPLIEADKGSPQ
jgi:cytochrome c biogenesis protein CcmG/thiol:disulfide interchange protein DsbE